MTGKRRIHRNISNYLTAALMVGFCWATKVEAADNVTPPDRFFGFQLGSDQKLARWDRIVEYFELLDRESQRIRTVNLGPSTEDHPFLLVIITAPENHAKLERLREVNLRIQNPRTPEDEVRALIAEGKAVVSQSLGLHATEVGGAQTAPELAYDLAQRDDEETLRILHETILLLLPCINPDGQIMVTDYYRETLGTEYEATGLPWLYHKYAGHDNNRDGDFLNLAESVLMAKVLYREWKPQAYIDHHQMGSYGARFFVPPYSDPIRPYGDPLMWREISWYGAHIAYKLEEHGKQGILNAAMYPGWGHFGWHWITPFHNIAGMLTESASARIASPLFIHPDQLNGGSRQFPTYEAQSTMPSPWPGGWWRLRDIVEQQKIAAWALQDLAARNRETVLWNAYLKAKRQTERGAQGSPKAYVIPAKQHDAVTSVKMINTLLQSDVEIQRAEGEFAIGDVHYGPGSFVVSLAQPKMGLIRNLLGRTLYPDNTWTRDRDGSPLRPYDTATHTMAEFMGVRVDPVDGPIEADLLPVTAAVPLDGKVAAGQRLRLDGRLNVSYRAVNLLLDNGVSVARADRSGGGLHVGDFVVEGAAAAVLEQVAGQTGAGFEAIANLPGDGMHAVRRMRLGMYQRYGGGNMDEGWTRLVLEQFSFPFASVKDAEITGGGLNDKYDVIIIPHDSTASITGEGGRGGRGRGGRVTAPQQYRSGLGAEGVEALKAYVEAGGTLVALGGAGEFAIDTFQLSVRDVLARLDSKDFFCPGSTLRVRFDNTHPLAYGMPSDGTVLFWQGPAFEIQPTAHNEDYERIVEYVDRDILQSGWLIGEEHLSRKAGMVSAKHGEGRVILIGFRTQHRAQTHGTFKLLFNALLQ